MVFTLANTGRKNKIRASLLYCANICGPEAQALSLFKKMVGIPLLILWNYGISKVATYVALVNDGFVEDLHGQSRFRK